MPAAAFPHSDMPGASGQTPVTIVVVDDEDDVRSLVVDFLLDSGYRVLSAGNGADALVLLAREPVDLLFTDIVMPGGLDGFDLARDAKQLRPDLKVLYTTGYQNLRQERAPQPPGRMLQKPYRPAQLLSEIRRTLGET